jgi:hypothetical protein
VQGQNEQFEVPILGQVGEVLNDGVYVLVVERVRDGIDDQKCRLTSQ